MRKELLLALMLGGAFGIAGCNDDNDLEDAVEEVEDGVEDTADDIGDAVDDATDGIDD